MMEEGPRGEGSEKNAFSPRPLPHRFLFQPPFTFRAAVTLSKHNKYRQLRRLASPHVGMLEWQELFWGDWTCNTVWRKPPGDAGSIQPRPQGFSHFLREKPWGRGWGPFTGPQGWATAAKTSLLKWIRVFFKRSENFRCRHLYSLGLISWGPHSSLERERKIRRRLFTSSIRHKIKHFHVLISRAERD